MASKASTYTVSIFIASWWHQRCQNIQCKYLYDHGGIKGVNLYRVSIFIWSWWHQRHQPIQCQYLYDHSGIKGFNLYTASIFIWSWWHQHASSALPSPSPWTASLGGHPVCWPSGHPPSSPTPQSLREQSGTGRNSLLSALTPPELAVVHSEAPLQQTNQTAGSTQNGMQICNRTQRNKIK